MKTVTQIAKRATKVASDNSPLILTGVGVAGVVTTAYLTGQATIKAVKFLEDDRNGAPLSEVEFDKSDLRRIWKFYLPAVGVGSLTVAAVIGSNRIGTRRAAAVAAAYSISERAMSEYREKVIEKIGENKEREIRDEVAQDQVNRTAPANMLISSESGQILCHDAFSNQYFMSDMETLRKAQNDVNAQILHSDYATVSDLYHFIGAEGLEQTSVSSDMGWNTDKMLELSFSAVLYKEKTPCISISFATVPVRDPWRFC